MPGRTRPGFGWRLGAVALVALLWACASPARAPSVGGLADAMAQALRDSGQAVSAWALPEADDARAPRLLRHFMTDPPTAWQAVDQARTQWPALRHEPDELLRRLLALGPPVDGEAGPLPRVEPVAVPPDAPPALGPGLQRALDTLALAEAWRQHAFARLPADTSVQALIASALPGTAGATEARPSDWNRLWPLVDQRALNTSARLTWAAAHQLHALATGPVHLPAWRWRAETPWGTVVVDTTGEDNLHQIAHPYLVLDVGGNDRYEWGGTGPARAGIKLLLDHGGNDSHHSRAPGTDASAAVMGVALLWDTQGDDKYQAGWLAQGAALLGVAWHIDDRGNNRYRAAGMAQAFALAGTALLLGSPGADSYHAQTLAQASAGPGGLSLLLDPGGDDSYQLDNTLLLWPSSQLPDHNASMGQGAGYGGRGPGGALQHPAGLAWLIDAAGSDRYEAQVFAQGAGYAGGAGLLLDLDGADRHQAAWYAMGAAAHGGLGLLWAGGRDNDHYEASHVMAMGAGHDGGMGLMVDGGGEDHFELGDLGLGAAHDGGSGALVRTEGRASYLWHGPACRGMGQRHGLGGAAATGPRGVALFHGAEAPTPRAWPGPADTPPSPCARAPGARHAP